jgi:hypothetical protein
MANLNPTDTEFFLSRCEREFDPQTGEMILHARNVAQSGMNRRVAQEACYLSAAPLLLLGFVQAVFFSLEVKG